MSAQFLNKRIIFTTGSIIYLSKDGLVSISPFHNLTPHTATEPVVTICFRSDTK